MKQPLLSKRKKLSRGFTLIEVMIATGLFVVIMIVGIGSLLSVHKTYQINKGMRELTDNINAVMEDMSRNIRLGRNLRCERESNAFNTMPATPSEVEPQDCTNTTSTFGLSGGYALMFIPQEGQADTLTDRVVYRIEPRTATSQDWQIAKSTDGGTSYSVITLPGVFIDPNQTGFTVLGSGSSDSKQPYVLIRLVGSAKYQNTTIPFNLQTTVTTRDLDIDVTTTP